MKLTNDVVHAVVGDTFVMGLHDLVDYEITVKFMVQQSCYLYHLSSSIKNHECESFNVLVDHPEVKKDPVNPTKTIHSKLDCNKLSTILNHSTFDSTVKMLELNTDNKITFVVEMVKANLLRTMFEPINSKLVFTAGLNELDLIKLKLPTKEELK